MKVLGISGSLRRESYNTSLLRAAAELMGEESSSSCGEGLKAVPPYDADEDIGERAGSRRSDALGDRRRRRRPLRDARVQLLDPGPVEERARLGVAAARHERPPEQARRGRGSVAPARSAPCGRRPTSERCWPRSAPASFEGEVAVGHAHTRFDEQGRLIDDEIREQLAEVVDGLIAAARARVPQAQAA